MNVCYSLSNLRNIWLFVARQTSKRNSHFVIYLISLLFPSRRTSASPHGSYTVVSAPLRYKKKSTSVGKHHFEWFALRRRPAKTIQTNLQINVDYKILYSLHFPFRRPKWSEKRPNRKTTAPPHRTTRIQLSPDQQHHSNSDIATQQHRGIRHDFKHNSHLFRQNETLSSNANSFGEFK